MKEEERKKVKEQVLKQENELKAAQDEHNAVRAKLAALERKIIVGGWLTIFIHFPKLTNFSNEILICFCLL